jgi:cytochrome c oxidase cbb3-type subunit I
MAAANLTYQDEVEQLVNYPLVKAWLSWALIWLMVFPLVGFLVSIKFNYPTFLGSTSWFTFGRLRPVHVNGVIFGAFSTTVFGLSFYMVPKLCGIRMYWEKLGWPLLWLWNVTLVAGSISLMMGYNHGIEAGEYPLGVDFLVIIEFAVLSTMILTTVIKRKEKLLYVALYYLTASMIWTTLNYALGHLIIPYYVPGVNNAALHGLYIHYVVGLWITPAGLSLIYFFLPLASKNPLYSHKLSLIGFWSIAFFYPFVGIHHYLYSPIPNWTQTIAIVTSMMLIVPVWTVIQNFFGTMVGNWKAFQESYVAKFLIVGSLYYLLGCFQGSTEALRSMQKLTHWTDFVIAHSHLTVFGTFVIWAMAGIYYVWPRVTGRPLWSRRLADWHYWLIVTSFSVMAAVLTVMGLIQGTMWATGVDFVDSMVAMKPYWFIRTLSGLGMDIGIALFLINLFMSARQPAPAGGPRVEEPEFAGARR